VLEDLAMETTEWPWQESFDALIAAPDYLTLLLDDQRLRVLETAI